LSLSTHNNISFANGSEKGWMLGKDASFYNAIGPTKELNDKFSINAVVSNIYSKIASDADKKSEQNSFGVGAKFIVAVAENAEFNIGAAMTTSSTTGKDNKTVTTFSIPVRISLKF
jgi:hypothetical protein